MGGFSIIGEICDSSNEFKYLTRDREKWKKCFQQTVIFTLSEKRFSKIQYWRHFVIINWHDHYEGELAISKLLK